MPPGPPVLQTLVAEVYGPDAQTRRQVAHDMTQMFIQAEDVVDVDNYMIEDYHYWRFEVDIEKAVRYGISVDMINQQLDMAMGGYRLGDIKRKVVREPTYIVMQVPLAMRSQVTHLYSVPVMTPTGHSIPLGELGRFTLAQEDPIVYHKDLRPIEYVTAEMEGKLGAPIYGMHAVEEQLKTYRTPDAHQITGLTLGGTIGRYGAPADDNQSGFEWGGEWTVTYETFRDMGAAFMAALVLIYALIVWEFRNFTLAGLIMAPIPLTLIGIIPGHLIIGAEFTATSMIGFIALAGIIVRNSILLVEFVSHEVQAGNDIVDAVIIAGQIRMRPILITAGTLMVGAAMLFSDPIFVGMAASLFFGTLVATVLTLVVIPLGCITVQKQFYWLAGIESPQPEQPPSSDTQAIPAWLTIWQKIIFAFTWLMSMLQAFSIMLKQWLAKRTKGEPDDSPPEPDSGGSTPPPDSSPPPHDVTASEADKSETNLATQAHQVKHEAVMEQPKPTAKKKRTKKASKKSKSDSVTKQRRGIRLKEI